MTTSAIQGNQRNRNQDQAAILARLRQAETYPERPETVEMLETHMSWIFFSGTHVYKMKKPVFNPVVDLRTVEARRRHCSEEVRLNTRLAADVYQGIVPLTLSDKGVMRLSGTGSVVDWLVKMQRLPSERMLDRLIDNDRLTREDIDRLSNVLTDFYHRYPSAAPGILDYVEEIEHSLETDRHAFDSAPYDFSDKYIPVLQTLQKFVSSRRQLLEDRVTEGWIVEGHGDLRPEHVCLKPRPVIFDCLVFDYRLRIIDPVDELAFLSMECTRLGAEWVEAVLFANYSESTSDIPSPHLIAFYKCYRACRWTRLACWRMESAEKDEKWRHRAEEYLRLATRYSTELV